VQIIINRQKKSFGHHLGDQLGFDLPKLCPLISAGLGRGRCWPLRLGAARQVTDRILLQDVEKVLTSMGNKREIRY